MKTDLQRELYKRHSSMLNQARYDDINAAIIRYGFQFGDGWFSIVDNYLTEIETLCDNYNNVKPLFLQIKEKFGHLRIYFDYTNNEELNEKLDAITEFYINRSKTTCEACGVFAEIETIRNSKKCLCEECFQLFKHSSYSTADVLIN